MKYPETSLAFLFRMVGKQRNYFSSWPEIPFHVSISSMEATRQGREETCDALTKAHLEGHTVLWEVSAGCQRSSAGVLGIGHIPPCFHSRQP